jgi:GPH family glycoside/pentoside/hexuronide:cation symporter
MAGGEDGRTKIRGDQESDMNQPIGQVAANRGKLPFGQKVGYAMGEVLNGIVTQSLGIFLLFYVTAVCGLPGGLAGIALAVGLVVDAVLDPLIGSASDGWRSRLGRRLPFMLAGLPAVAILFVAIFNLPSGLSTMALFAWLTTLSVLLRIAMSLFILPYSAVGAELSEDYHERSSIMTWRVGIGMLGTLVAVILGFGIFFAGAGGTMHRAAYLPFAITLAAIFVVCGLISSRVLTRTLDRQHPPVVTHGRLHVRVWRELGEVFRNRSFRILFISALLFFAALGTHATLGLHTNTFFWHFSSGQTQTVTLAVFAGLLAGAPLAGPMLKRMEKRTVLLIGLIGLAVSESLPAGLRLLGLFPFTGDRLMLVISCIVFVGGVLMSAAAIAFASMMADAADEHEHLFGARREGLYFAGWAFATKAAGGAGALIAGMVLQVIAFPTNVAQQGTAAALPEHTLYWLGFFYGPGAGLLYLGSIVMTFLYRIDAKTHAAIMRDLTARRIAAAAPARGDSVVMTFNVGVIGARRAFLAIETGGTKVLARLFGEGLCEEARWPTTTPDAMADAIAAFVAERLPASCRLAAAGLAAFGPLLLEGPKAGRLLSTPKPGWAGSNLRAALADRLGCPVAIDTDVNAAARAELAVGAAAGLPSAAYVTIGTGIGAGLAWERGTLRGALHPEIGHLRLVRAEGDDMPSVCPFHLDCAEGLASGPAVGRRLDGAALAERQDIQQLTGLYIAQLLVAMVLAWSPHRIVLGGGIGGSDGMIDIVRQAYHRELGSYGVGEIARGPQFIQPAALIDAGLEGAALLAQSLCDREDALHV